ncbi:MAG TPA: hypothetical protein ENJ18_09765 [Nannocystis exedens]|nr:hypothetical protein [Nannocystis exedens]
MPRNTRISRSKPFYALFSVLVLSLGGACLPDYGSIEVEVGSSPPVPVSIRSRDFQVPVGISVLINVTPISDNNNEYVETDTVELTSQDRAILDVEPGPEDRSFVLVGVDPGSTCVEVAINGSVEDCIPTEVLAQN